MQFAILVNTTEGAYLIGPIDNEPEAMGLRDDLINNEIEATYSPDELREMDMDDVIDEIASAFTVLCMTKDGNWSPDLLRPISCLV